MVNSMTGLSNNWLFLRFIEVYFRVEAETESNKTHYHAFTLWMNNLWLP